MPIDAPINLSRELAVSGGMFVLTVVLHLAGLMGLIEVARLHLTHARTPWLTLDRFLVPMLMALGLFALHSLEVLLYAALFDLVGATSTWEQAIYYSAASYSTAGVAGLTFLNQWRVTGGLESLNGMLLIGWSTAFLFQNLHRIMNGGETEHPLPEGAIARPPDLEEAAPVRATRPPSPAEPRRDAGGRAGARRRVRTQETPS